MRKFWIAFLALTIIIALVSVFSSVAMAKPTTTTTELPAISGTAPWNNTESVNKVKLGQCYTFKWQLSAGGKDLTYTDATLFVKWDMDGDLATTDDIVTTSVGYDKINSNGSVRFYIDGKYPLDAWVEWEGLGVVNEKKTPELNLNGKKKIECPTTTSSTLPPTTDTTLPPTTDTTAPPTTDTTAPPTTGTTQPPTTEPPTTVTLVQTGEAPETSMWLYALATFALVLLGTTAYKLIRPLVTKR
jgi:hypothetical protein